MHDLGHELTEKELAELEKRIARIYREARDDLDETIKNYFANFIARDKKQLELLKEGKITEDQYKQWRLNQIGRGKRFDALRNEIAERYTKANEVANAYVNDETPGIYALNRNYAAYTIEQEAGDVGFTLFDEQTVKRLAVEEPDLMSYYPPQRALKRNIDLVWGKRQITASVTSGILQGKSIGKIANDLQSRMETMNRASAIRTARTAVTGAQNAGRQDSYIAAEKKGIKLKREWMATPDMRTRHAHAKLDGQRVGVNEPFKVDGYEIMFPGDPTAEAYLVYNCRCTLIVAVDGVDTSDAMRRARDPETGESVLVKNMTYQKWEKNKHSIEKKISGGIIKEITSGALNPESDRAKDHAMRYYESVRRMTTDIEKISQNTGFSVIDIKNIKSFVFFEEHELEPGVFKRFDPSYEMAESWQRLIDGKDIMPHDITLLRHEMMESSLMLQGLSQDEAHIKATKEYNYAKEARLYYDQIKKHQEK